jgi:hypothetical protein
MNNISGKAEKNGGLLGVNGDAENKRPGNAGHDPCATFVSPSQKIGSQYGEKDEDAVRTEDVVPVTGDEIAGKI